VERRNSSNLNKAQDSNIGGGGFRHKGAKLPNFKLKSTNFTDFVLIFLIFTMEICCFFEH
jgi:hypothetical protein